MKTTLKCLRFGGWVFEYAAYGLFTLGAYTIMADATATFEAMRYFGL